MDDVDRAIADYRAELAANAAIGAGEADELEDHLRLLIDELRAAGATTQAAIAAARVRLGAPREIAAESTRRERALEIPVEDLAHHMWATVHGYVSLELSGMSPLEPEHAARIFRDGVAFVEHAAH